MPLPLDQYTTPGSILERQKPPQGGTHRSWKRTSCDGEFGPTYHDSLIEALAFGCPTLPILVKSIQIFQATFDDLVRADSEAAIRVIRKISMRHLQKEIISGVNRETTDPKQRIVQRINDSIAALTSLQGLISIDFPIWDSLQELIELAKILLAEIEGEGK